MRGKGAKGLPLAELRELFKDERVHIDIGVVFKPDGLPHYYKETGNGRAKVMIEVETSKGLDLTCRLATRPVWYIPTPGTVVIVAVPLGELEQCPSVVGVLDSGDADDEIGTDKTLFSTEETLVFKAPLIKHGVNASQSHVQGENIKSALDTLAGAIGTYAAAIKSIADPPGLATTALANAITQFLASSYLSSKAKTE